MADGTTRVRYQGIKVSQPPPPRRDISVLIVVIIVVALILIAAIIVLIVFALRPASGGGEGTGTQGQLNGACFSNGTCTIGLICDSTNNICKKDVGVECSSNSECVSGSLCNGGTCKLTYNQVCFNDNECIFPGTCPEGVCTTLGNQCAGTIDCIMPGLSPGNIACDPTRLVCVSQVGQPCVASVDCGSDAMCDTTLAIPQCRLLPGEACANSAQCFNRSVCDGQCSFSTCMNDEECLNGFICTARICTPLICEPGDCDENIGPGWSCTHALTPDTGDQCNNAQVCATDPNIVFAFCPGDVDSRINGVSDGGSCQTSAECLSFSCNQTTFTCNPAT